MGTPVRPSLRADQPTVDAVLGELGDDVVTVIDSDLRIRWQSSSTLRIFGRESATRVGYSVLDGVHPGDLEQARAALERAVGGNRPTDPMLLVRCRIHDADGAWHDVETSVSDRRDDADIQGIVLHSRDVTERMTLQRQLERMAFTDVLTGLGNRASLFERLERGLAVNAPLTVLALDIDGFRKVNDLYGHDVGDGLLVEAGNRLASILRDTDVIARTSADEFVVLLDGHAASARGIADRMHATLSQPFTFPEGRVEITACIGLTRTGTQADTAEVLREADLALRRAQQSGRGRTEMFEPELQVDVIRTLTMERDLRTALETTDLPGADQLEAVFQPVMRFADRQVASLEALLRWRHPQLGDIAPDEFIGIAEESGLILALGRWVLGQGCAQAARWVAAGHDIRVAVNVSVRQVQSRRLVSDVRSALDAAGLPANRLILEITESVLLGETDRTAEDLNELHDMGCRIALDDFGQGYSSLSYLRRLPVDVLKIDRAFVAGVPHDPALTALTESTVLLGNRLGLEVVCEGVETDAQFDALSAMDATYAQGFGLAGPASAADVTVLLDRQRPPVASRPVGSASHLD